MKSSALKIAAVLMCLATVATALAACSSKKSNEEELIYEEDGKIYYRPEEGAAAYELATDANGETLVDAQGNLLWKVTNAAGEDQTHPVSFPDYLQDGKKLSCQQFTIKVPRGWENIGNTAIMLRNDKKNYQINYSFFESTEETVETAEGRVAQTEEMFQVGVESGEIELETSDSSVAGKPAKKLVVKITGDSENGYMETYFVTTDNGVMSFACTCEAKDGGKFDFLEILNTLEYRI